MIPGTFSEAFTQVKTLVEKFQKTEAHYLSPKYQEAEVRQEFLAGFREQLLPSLNTIFHKIGNIK